MLLAVARDWLIFAAVVLGGGAALAPARSNPDRLEAWCTGIAWALGVTALGVFAVFAAGLPNGWIAAPLLALGVVAAVRRREIAGLAADPAVREAFWCWTLLSLWGLALLACVFSFSGGGWMGDWEEHYQRPLLHLRLRAEDAEFRQLFTLPARPPLANLADAALLWLTDAGFARHQVFMLLLNSLAFLPAALFCRTLGGGRASAAWMAWMLMLNPLFLQNATYPWTKLITAFFVLTGLHVLLARPADSRRTVAGLALLMLGVLTHYSACVWLLVFAAAWILGQRARWTERGFWTANLRAALAGGLLLLPWVGYTLTHYGWGATLGSNTAARTAAHFTWGQNLLNTVPKLWNTLVPHPLRDFDRAFIAQANPWTGLRDHLFYVYQSNLFFAVGTAGLILLAWIALQPRRHAPDPRRRIWWIALPAAVVLGTAVHGHVDEWGLVHICLIPLVLLGVALAASRLPGLIRSRAAPWILGGAAVGWALDFYLGLVLHYAGQALQLGRAPGENLLDYVRGLAPAARHNFWQKVKLGQDFLAEQTDVSWWQILALLGAVAGAVLLRAWRLSRTDGPDRTNPA
jgi:hypothetical protein